MRAKPSSLDLIFALGYVIPTIGITWDLHPIDNAHAERTKKVGTSNNGCTHLFLLRGSDYLTTNFLPFLIYTPFEASPVMRRPARSKIGAFVTSAPSTSGIPIAEGVSWKLNVRALAVGEQYLLATLAAWREKYHAINICEKKLSQRHKERKDHVRSKRF